MRAGRRGLVLLGMLGMVVAACGGGAGDGDVGGAASDVDPLTLYVKMGAPSACAVVQPGSTFGGYLADLPEARCTSLPTEQHGTWSASPRNSPAGTQSSPHAFVSQAVSCGHLCTLARVGQAPGQAVYDDVASAVRTRGGRIVGLLCTLPVQGKVTGGADVCAAAPVPPPPVDDTPQPPPGSGCRSCLRLHDTNLLIP